MRVGLEPSPWARIVSPRRPGAAQRSGPRPCSRCEHKGPTARRVDQGRTSAWPRRPLDRRSGSAGGTYNSACSGSRTAGTTGARSSSPGRFAPPGERGRDRGRRVGPAVEPLPRTHRRGQQHHGPRVKVASPSARRIDGSDPHRALDPRPRRRRPRRVHHPGQVPRRDRPA